MTKDLKPASRTLAKDVADYLKAEDEKDRQERWKNLESKYDHEKKEGEKFEFYAEGHSIEVEKEHDDDDKDLFSFVADYLNEEESTDKLEKFRDLLDEFTYEQRSRTQYRFFNEGESSEVSAPSLEHYHHVLEGEDLDEDEEFYLRSMMGEAYREASTRSKTVFTDGETVLLESDDDLKRIEDPREAISMQAVVEFYRDARENADDREDLIFNELRKNFSIGEIGQVEIFTDESNQKIALFDKDTLDFELIDREDLPEEISESLNAVEDLSS